MDPHSRAPKKNASLGNKVLPQDTTHLIQRPVTNEEVRAKIQQAIQPRENLLTIVNRRKPQWYGHVSRSSGLHLASTVKGGRRQGRQRKKWEDNIRAGVHDVPEAPSLNLSRHSVHGQSL